MSVVDCIPLALLVVLSIATLKYASTEKGTEKSDVGLFVLILVLLGSCRECSCHNTGCEYKTILSKPEQRGEDNVPKTAE